jgi:hypothetical protein
MPAARANAVMTPTGAITTEAASSRPARYKKEPIQGQGPGIPSSCAPTQIQIWASAGSESCLGSIPLLSAATGKPRTKFRTRGSSLSDRLPGRGRRASASGRICACYQPKYQPPDPASTGCSALLHRLAGDPSTANAPPAGLEATCAQGG